MKVLTITNHKGGVGKTTLVGVLLHNLCSHIKVLGIDLDPQAHLTLLFSESPFDENLITSYEFLIKKVFNPIKLKNFDLIPSNLKLATAELELINMHAREYRLKKALESIPQNYDLVLIDTPPSLSVLTLNAIFASDGILIPVETKLFGLAGLSYLLKVLDELKEYAEINILGIVPTFYEKQITLHKEVLEKLETLPYRVFSPIPKRSAFQYFVETKELNLDKETKTAIDEIVKEVLKWVKT